MSPPAFSLAIRFRLEIVFLIACIWLIRALPMDLAIRAMGTLFAYFPPLSQRHARAAANIARAYPQLEPKSRRKLLRSMWRNYGMTVAETFLVDRIAQDPGRIELDEASAAAVRLAGGGGVVFVCPHLGNWEVSIVPLFAKKINHAAVYTRVKNPHFEAVLYKLRRRYYPGGLHARGAHAAKALSRHLRAGGTVGVMGDLRDDHFDCMAPFFGRYAPSTIFPATLARHYRRPLIADCLVRTGPGRFKMKVEHIEAPRTDDRDADIYAATAAIQACFERWIRQNPDQWLWTHRRYHR